MKDDAISCHIFQKFRKEGNLLKVLIDSIREAEAYRKEDYKKLLDLMEAYIGLNEGRFLFMSPMDGKTALLSQNGNAERIYPATNRLQVSVTNDF